jgi:hypothetical protein
VLIHTQKLRITPFTWNLTATITLVYLVALTVLALTQSLPHVPAGWTSQSTGVKDCGTEWISVSAGPLMDS